MAAFNNDGKLKLLIIVGNDLGETMGNIIAKSYQLMAQLRPDAVLVLGDTNSCFSVIGAKRLHIPTLTFGFPLSRLGNAQASLAFRSLLHRFHMEAGNRCKDECLPEETNRRIVDIISDVNRRQAERNAMAA